MTALNIQAAQNEIIRQVLNTQDIHLLDRIRNLFANKEANEACMVLSPAGRRRLNGSKSI